MTGQIPKARDELLNCALGLERRQIGWDEAAAEIRRIVRERMFREPPKYPYAKAKHRDPTPEISKEIRLYKMRHPSASQREIADVFDVGYGRVSEALNWRR